jgi:uncharacterized membrane protein YagU involved in acid resistance
MRGAFNLQLDIASRFSEMTFEYAKSFWGSALPWEVLTHFEYSCFFAAVWMQIRGSKARIGFANSAVLGVGAYWLCQ